ncbi:MAG: TonB-dependent receptor plug domain-containing protein [Candidatus Baltobacteraceae bacterium]
MVRLDLALRPAEKVIERIVTARTRNASYKTISTKSSLSKVTPGLLAAMNAIPGIHVAAGASGLGASASIRGQDPSMTSYTINGVNVGNSAASTIDSDLLNQAQVDAQNDLLAYSFLSPSMHPLYHASAQQGAYGLSVIKGSFQDTVGTVGLAVAHATRSADSALNGQIYVDQSGYAYPHFGAIHIIGNYADLTLPLGSWDASLSDAVATSRKLPLSNIRTGSIATGYGPGEVLTSSSNNPVLSANGLLSNYAISVSVAAWGLHENDDYLTRTVGRVPSPFVSTNVTQGTDIYLAASSATQRTHTTLSFDATESSYRFSALGLPPNTVSVPKSTITLSQNGSMGAHLLDHLGLSAEIAGRRVSPAIDFAIRWPNEHGTQAYLVANGGRRYLDATSLGGTVGLSDPASATFDCANGAISTTGVGASTAAPSEYGLSAGYARQFRRLWLNLSGYDERIFGAIITDAPVAASAMPAGSLPPGFVGELQSAYGSIGGCAGPAPSPTSIFFSENVANVTAEYRGVSLDSQIELANNLSLEMRYGLTQAQILAIPSLLLSPRSPYVRGAQIPNVPLNEFGITADWHPSHYVELLANADVTSRNNFNNLPTYTRIDGGLLLYLSRVASLSVVGSNITNQFVGYFVSPQYSVPLPAQEGIGFPTLADPLPHSALYVQLNLRLRERGRP